MLTAIEVVYAVDALVMTLQREVGRRLPNAPDLHNAQACTYEDVLTSDR